MQVLFQGVGWYLTESDEEHKLCQALGRDVSYHNYEYFARALARLCFFFNRK